MAANPAEHEISFDEAKTVFDDPLYVDFYDPDHSYVVCLISAREVTAAERKAYEEG